MNRDSLHFNAAARLLHWLMAVLILTMLFVGVGMVSTVSRLHDALLALHRPLGVTLLVLVVIRAAIRVTHRTPPLPADMPPLQRVAAKASHYALYAMMLAMPLIGWSMLSAGGYPVVLARGVQLPPIAPHNVTLYAVLRSAHTWVAFALYATVLLHVAAALFHAWIRRDGVFASMARGQRRA
ncbi:MAG TPA: cytochrome b [Paraburkholderia sp.]|jgi:cytochrome b561|nr:cytochrome b [Paraburkholderia sp.]